MNKPNEARYYVHGVEVPQTPPARAKDQEPWDETRVLGEPLPRVDGYERVSGTAVYPADMSLPRMLYGAILRCPHPSAVVTGVDTSGAEGMAGVHAVISAFTPEDDTTRPHDELIRSTLFNTRCRYEGEAVAAVAAESPYIAHDALRAINVEYEVLPFVADERRALEPDAPKVHETGNQVSDTERYERGDVEQGLREADVVLEEEYRCECEIHTPMEPHGCVASWDGDRLTIWESTQGVYNIQTQVAASLGVPLSKVRVVGHYMGGGFGSKLQAGRYTLTAALLAKQTARPVKLTLTREETYLAVGNRPPSNMRLKAGVKRDGTLTALDYSGTGTGGAARAGGTSLLDWLIRDLYLCPNVRTELTDVYVNAGPARPFRAPGHPQCAWALEQMMDALAVAIDMDPVQLRLKNVPTVSQGRNGIPYTTTGLQRCLEEGAREFRWEETKNEIASGDLNGDIRRGVGMGSGLWAGGGGGPPSTAIVKIYSDGSINLNMGASDIGTGTKTVMAMVVAEELGVSHEDIQVEHADTGTTQYATASGGSKTVPTESPAVRAAAIDAREQLFEIAAEEMEVDVSVLSLRDGKVVATGETPREVNVAELQGLRRRGNITGVGYRGPNPSDKAVNPFAAQFCEVEVNIKTGEVNVVRFLGAHDSGRVMNRLTYQNQVFGGITMGIGLGMTEQRLLDVDQTGKMVNKNWHDYKLPTAVDVPADMTCVPIDPHDTECNTTGAKGIGEPATIPTAAVVANAVYHATGVRITDTPIDPTKLVNALAAARGGE
ncbi:MAG: xanthine dehydrogenase family protein molybdopterin-binding subunit [Gemmatimonadota bacterium]|nr:MAG: xanthine dehydrogenase family protein molybdopterin-binding subunit [Gemmatimonadota bacterium]